MSLGKPQASFAGIAEKLGRYASELAKAQPGARVRLARPLQSPAEAPQATPSPLAQPGASKASSVDAILGLDSKSAAGKQPKPPYEGSLEAFRVQIAECERCPLGGRRKHLVFGAGDPQAELVLVGSAPAPEDDSSGQPFSGSAGDLLDRIVAAMGYKRSQVYLCNVVKCRPQAKLAPSAAEVEACRPYLEHQLGLLKPKALVALGPLAASLLLDSSEPLAKLRGRWGAWKGLPVMATYHPLELLADPGLKRHVWDDMKQVMQKIRPQ